MDRRMDGRIKQIKLLLNLMTAIWWGQIDN